MSNEEKENSKNKKIKVKKKQKKIKNIQKKQEIMFYYVKQVQEHSVKSQKHFI